MSAALAVAEPQTDGMSDKSLTGRLQSDPNLLDRMQMQATAAFHTARSCRLAPTHALQAQWNRFYSLVQAAHREHQPHRGTRTAADWAAQVKLLRLALDAKAHFDAFVQRWDKLSDAERGAAASQMSHELYVAQVDKEQAHMLTVAAAAPRVSIPEQIARFARAGVRLAVSPDGDLLVNGPSGVLTDADRTLFRTMKGAFVDALGGAGEVF
jgi:hypothetical protein